MVDDEDGRICEVLNHTDPLSWTAAKQIQQSKTVGAISGSSPSDHGFLIRTPSGNVLYTVAVINASY